METNQTNIPRLLYLLNCVLTISIVSRSQLLAFLKTINKEINLLNWLIMVYSKNTPTKKPRVWYSIGNASFFPLEKNKEETCAASQPALVATSQWAFRRNLSMSAISKLSISHKQDKIKNFKQEICVPSQWEQNRTRRKIQLHPCGKLIAISLHQAPEPCSGSAAIYC